MSASLARDAITLGVEREERIPSPSPFSTSVGDWADHDTMQFSFPVANGGTIWGPKIRSKRWAQLVCVSDTPARVFIRSYTVRQRGSFDRCVLTEVFVL